MKNNKSSLRRSPIQRLKSMSDSLINRLKAGSQMVFELLSASFSKPDLAASRVKVPVRENVVRARKHGW